MYTLSPEEEVERSHQDGNKASLQQKAVPVREEAYGTGLLNQVNFRTVHTRT